MRLGLGQIMSRSGLTAIQRTKSIARHMMSTASGSNPGGVSSPEDPVLFETSSATRSYILNRPSKRNALNTEMLHMLRPQIETWATSDLCGAIIARGNGPAFCAGGDVADVVNDAKDPSTRPKAIAFFRREFEMDYILAALSKPYVAIMDGITMGGGVGLSAPAIFRVATEKTAFAMPETKIGYSPDVGANFYLSRLDGELGTYLALTGDILKGRSVFDLGLATHFVHSARIPQLVEALSSLETPSSSQINSVIEEFSTEREPDEPTAQLTGDIRIALDDTFKHNTVEEIVAALERVKSTHLDSSVSQWATNALQLLSWMSPTSLKVALRAIRTGKTIGLRAAFLMELRIATAYCSGASPDFATGVTSVLIEKKRDQRPAWNPPALEEVTDEIISRFFDKKSKFLKDMPDFVTSQPNGFKDPNPSLYTLPTETAIKNVVQSNPPGGLGLTYEELLEKFDSLYEGKIGVTHKVMEVVKRKCEVVDNKDGNFVWLRWKGE